MKIKRFLRKIGVFILVFAWLFSGWPPIWQSASWRIPPKIREVRAADITLRGTPKLTGVTNGADVTLTFDTGGGAPQTGDVVIFFGGSGSDGTGTTKGPSTTGYTLIDITSGADVQVGAWYKVMGLTPDTTVVGLGGGDTGDAVAYGAYVIDGTTLDAAIFDQTTTKVGQVTGVPNAPAIITQTAGALVIALAGGHLTDATPGTITGYTNAVSAAPNDTDDITLAAATKIAASPGTEDPAAWSSWTSANYIAITIALKPAANAAPTLSISQPDGVSDTVIVGQSYNITYTLSDPDDVVTAAFYYDTNNTGLDGTAISGACATAAEGTGVTCSWDTTGMTPGSYYVYGITNDGVNPQVSAYSSGQITINAAAVSVSVSDGTITYGTMAAGASKTTIDLTDTQTLTNDGNVLETFNIKGQNTACPWTLAATAGTDQYVHEFCKKTDVSCASPPTNYTALTTTYQTLYTSVAAAGTKQLDLRITVPTTSSCSTQQSADVTIQAVQQ